MPRKPRYVVIMAGGHGTRFWPRSRRRIPKQLLAISGGRTMLQETAQRARRLCAPERTLIVAATEHAPAVRKQVASIPRDNVVVEPVGRNTAPCIALAAEIIARRAEDATMVVLPADHSIRDVRAFVATLRRAIALAEAENCLVTLGVRPSYPETGYGYIEVGEPIDSAAGPGAYWAAAFHEKPDRATAEAYLAGGRHLWNAGMFVWPNAVIRDAIARQLPDLAAAVAPVGRSANRRQRDAAVRRAYRRIKGVSIDKGVLERADRVAVVEANFGWSDVGSWAAMSDLWGTDGRGNATRGTVVALDSIDNVVFSPSRVVALVGVRDLIVVDSDDAILVCRRDRAQDVRLVVDEIMRRRLRRLL